ncbi:hypothetical protein EN809_008385 [Mesorhizobium sp. M2E.F.Ca.ET.166.01.1.1]|nr:hypothetical protein EN862_002175 [Mesorhizobium sp. M2E.F.Ca.ET.219.01.1.1]TGT78056.1 hypothetical protein EN809_008385 [Mesorhizobium sp. M2E.F.Ca.ET.166.01.1.1]TGW04173.1 hypothetical protein EN797_008385 [Mesorhizobium sp. M2E.F.Ca.ET.154.01.1.1]
MGGRLLAMVNAKALADTLGYRFGFTWWPMHDDEFHSVEKVDKIFSADFIEKHWLGERVEPTGFDVLKEVAFTRASLDAAAGRRSLRGWICNEFKILDFFRGGPELVRRSETLRGFGFSQAVNQAFDAADRRPFPGPTAALHLRSGDIVRGKYRFMLDFSDKVVASALVKSIASELSSKGLTTLLIGQDRATLEYLRSQTGALLSDDLGSAEFEDETLRAFFEMRLMARCRTIYAGSSVYASVASTMGDIALVHPKTLFGGSKAAEMILGELSRHQSDYHPLEAAFGYQSAFLDLEGQISPTRAKNILGKAYALDPENDIYPLKIAVAFFRDRDYRSGEAVLKALMTRQFEASSAMPLRAIGVLVGRSWLGHVMSKDFEFFFAAAADGHPYAAACSAHILHVVFGKLEPARRMIAMSLEAEPDNALFKRIKRHIRPLVTPQSGLLAKARLRLWKAGIRI